MAKTAGAAAEVLLTKYLIFTSADEGITWTRVGQQDGRSSDSALRQFFANPPRDEEGQFVAVSVNAFKPQKVAARVKTSLSRVELADVQRSDDTLPVEQEDADAEQQELA